MHRSVVLVTAHCKPRFSARNLVLLLGSHSGMATEHSKAFHDSCILKLCRVCGNREKVRSDKRDKRSSVYRCEKFSDEILTVFGINVSSDEEGKHPSPLFTRCYRTIINSRKLQGGTPQSRFVSQERKAEVALTDSKWSVWSCSASRSISNCFSCSSFSEQRKGGRPPLDRRRHQQKKLPYMSGTSLTDQPFSSSC